MDDIGLQRAILASLANGGGGGGGRGAAPPPRPSGGGGGASSSHFSSNLRSNSNRAVAGTAQDWGLRGGGGGAGCHVPIGRRNQLEREGIMPRQGHTFQSGKAATPVTRNAERGGGGGPFGRDADPHNHDTSGTGDDDIFGARPQQFRPANPRGFYDRLVAWREATVGGRSQAQNPAQDHILLVTEEALPDRLSAFDGSECLLIGREDPIDMATTAGGRGATIKLQLKYLTGSGRYSTFAIGFATRSIADGSARGFVGLSIHYEFTGAVYVSVDEWTATRASNTNNNNNNNNHSNAFTNLNGNGNATENTPASAHLYRRLERTVTLEKAQQVKPKRDGLEIRVPFTNRSIDVIINDHLHFKNVMGLELGGDSEGVFVCLVAAGGRFSAKHLEISDGLQSGSSSSRGGLGIVGGSGGVGAGSGGVRVGSSSPPPLAPTRSNPSLRGGGSGAVAGRRAPSRQPGGGVGAASGGSRVGSHARASPSPRATPGRGGNTAAGSNSRAQSSQQQGNSNNNNNVAGYDPNDPFVQMVEAEIIDRSPAVEWEDIAGVGDAKAVLNEAVVLPLLVPELFTGVRQPWKGVLLYGPPGTGKTMLAKAVATSAKTTFYSISASTLVSKFHGESEKLVKALFQSARAHAPSTIFFDEIDAIMSKRGGGNEHDASRRLKAEMLLQIDGVGASVDGGGRVMLLAATNTPWDLDEAMRRRLEKRIYVPLPDEEGRLDFLKRQTGRDGSGNGNGSSSATAASPFANKMAVDASVDLAEIAALADGYSGADMSQLCRDAAMMPMRRLIADKSPMQIAEMKQRGALTIPATSREDFVAALAKVKPSVSQNELGKYVEWTKEFSSI